MAMKKDAFLNPKAILTSMCGMLLGVVIYCGVIAPLFKDGTYPETAGETFRDTGLGMGVGVLVVGAVWLIAIALIRRGKNGNEHGR